MALEGVHKADDVQVVIRKTIVAGRGESTRLALDRAFRNERRD